jgi:hypothetical protein
MQKKQTSTATLILLYFLKLILFTQPHHSPIQFLLKQTILLCLNFRIGARFVKAFEDTESHEFVGGFDLIGFQ